MLTNVHLVKAMFFPVAMYGCKSWTIKKAEHQRTDAFELWCWRRLLRISRTVRRSNQSILKKISPEYSLEGLMLKLQYYGHLIRTDSLEKTLMLGKIEGSRRRRWRRMWWLDASLTWWTWVWASSWSWWWRGKPGVLQSMGLQRVRHDWLNWTDDTLCRFLFYVLNLNEEIHSISNLLRFCFYDLVFTFFKLFLCIFKTCKSL